jgi:hypothetical protein
MALAMQRQPTPVFADESLQGRISTVLVPNTVSWTSDQTLVSILIEE